MFEKMKSTRNFIPRVEKDEKGRIRFIDDGYHNFTKYEYDHMDRITRLTTIEMITVITYHDDHSDIPHTVTNYEDASLEHRVIHTFDKFGKKIEQDTFGEKTTFTESGKIKSKVKKNGFHEDYEYDSFDRIVLYKNDAIKIVTEWTDDGHIETKYCKDGKRSVSEYNKFGTLMKHRIYDMMQVLLTDYDFTK